MSSACSPGRPQLESSQGKTEEPPRPSWVGCGARGTGPPQGCCGLEKHQRSARQRPTWGGRCHRPAQTECGWTFRGSLSMGACAVTESSHWPLGSSEEELGPWHGAKSGTGTPGLGEPHSAAVPWRGWAGAHVSVNRRSAGLGALGCPMVLGVLQTVSMAIAGAA